MIRGHHRTTLTVTLLPYTTLFRSNYSHARYGSCLSPCYSGESIAAGCNTTFRGGTGQRLDGKPTTNSPPWTGSLGGSYDTDIGGGKSISLNVDTRYSD